MLLIDDALKLLRKGVQILAKAQKVVIELSKGRKSPLNSGIKNFNSIVEYFMYFAPNIECVHSVGKIANADDVLRKMLKQSEIEQTQACFVQRVFSTTFAKRKLDKLCLQPFRLLCKKRTNEDNLTCLLRHIRNSFAHGNVYIFLKRKQQPSFIILEDKEGGNEGKLTARIIITNKILETWKALLESEIALGE